MSEIVVVAPHPDDETLGCGGTILKHKSLGDKVHWLIVTCVSEKAGFSAEMVNARNQEVAKVAEMYGFDSVIKLDFPTTKLDTVPMQQIVELIGSKIQEIEPDVLYVPFPGDIHTDHRVVFQAIAACSKWFRYASIKRVLAYETLSETDFAINPEINAFRPNVFVDIGRYLVSKLEIMQIYKSEMGSFPFPRSQDAIIALARTRGTASGCESAEAFMLLKEIIR